MKKLITTIFVILIGVNVFAQTRMSYQAVARGSNNELISTSPIGMRITILQGSASGTPVYSETQSALTNLNGLFSVAIGDGNVTLGNLNTIDWSNGPYFIKTETDITGGTNYTISGISELMSVPYAKYAETTGTPGIQSVNGVQPVSGSVTLVKSDIGLGNVDNTSDADKPVSTAMQAALDQKADASSPVFTGTPTVPTAAPATNTTQIATTEFVTNAVTTAMAPDATISIKGRVALGGDLSGSGTTAEAPVITANAITTVKIADLNVTTAKIADNNVTTSKIADANVTTIKIADNNVTTAKIADANVTTAKIADANITEDKIANSAISFSKIQNISNGKVLGRITSGSGVVEEISVTGIGDVVMSESPNFSGTPEAPTPSPGSNDNQIATTEFVTNAVTAANTPDATTLIKGRVALGGDLGGTGTTAAAPVIAENAITTVKIADNNVTTAKIADANITTDKIADANVTTDKIADANVTYSKLQDISSDGKVLGRASFGAGVVEELSTTGTGDVVMADSPTFTGLPMAPTPSPGSNSNQISTTNFVRTMISAAEIKETPSGLGVTLDDTYSGKIVTTQWGGQPTFPDNLANGFSCTIINYSNSPFTTNALSTAFFFTEATGWNGGVGATSITIKSGGSVRLNVVDVNGVKGYFVTGDLQ